MNNIVDDLQYLKETKNLIKQAIIDRRVVIGDETTFRQYADKIRQITSGIATANFGVSGILTMQGSKYSDFGDWSYIYNTYHTNTGNIIYRLKIKTGTDGNEQYILASNPFSLFIINGFKLGSWNSISGSKSPYQLQPETWYYISMKCTELDNGTIHHEVFVSTEKFSTEQSDFAYDYEEVQRYDDPNSCYIGVHNNHVFPFRGTIDMYETKVVDSNENTVHSYYNVIANN